jgi:hypothetical protein
VSTTGFSLQSRIRLKGTGQALANPLMEITMSRRNIEPEFEGGKRVVSFCRRSASVDSPAGSHEHETAAQEDQLRKWLKQESTARIHVTVVKCLTVGCSVNLPYPVALRRSGFSVITIANLDRVARSEACR